MGVVDLAVADMLLEGKKLGVKARTSLIFIDPNFVLRQSLQTPVKSGSTPVGGLVKSG